MYQKVSGISRDFNGISTSSTLWVSGGLVSGMFREVSGILNDRFMFWGERVQGFSKDFRRVSNGFRRNLEGFMWISVCFRQRILRTSQGISIS